MFSEDTGSCFKSKSEYVTEELGMCCCNKVKRTKIHVKNVMIMVLRGLSYVAFTDSESTIGSQEAGRTVEGSTVMGCINVVVFNTRLLRESRQMEIDFVNQLDLYCRRMRQWELGSPAIPTRRLDERYLRLREKKFEWTSSVVKCMMGMLEANQLEYRPRLCEQELKRSGFDVECDVGCVATEDWVFGCFRSTSYGWHCEWGGD